MNTLVPEYILRQYSGKRLEGTLQASVLFLDIAGFTPMTERLMAYGSEGAEVLSEILHRVFSLLAQQVQACGGFIAQFNGDGFSAVFPESVPAANAVYAASKLLRTVQEHHEQRTRLGDYLLSIRIGVARGEVTWQIVDAEEQAAYVFAGPALRQAAAAERRCARMGVMLDASMAASTGGYQTVQQETGLYALLATEGLKCEPVAQVKEAVKGLQAAQRHFAPEQLLTISHTGEFRDVVCVFLAFQEPGDTGRRRDFLKMVIRENAKHGGFLANTDVADKGPTVFLLFGAPIAYEHPLTRALDCAASIQQASAIPVRIGMSAGTVYAGIIGPEWRCEYAVLGDRVNLAARIAEAAAWGQAWMDSELAHRCGESWQLGFVGGKRFKGMGRSVDVFRLSGRKQADAAAGRTSIFVDRETESAMLDAFLRPIYAGRHAGSMVIYGEPGIGKSRLVHDCLTRQPEAQVLTLRGDDMSRRELHPFIAVLDGLYTADAPAGQDEKTAVFREKYADFVRSVSGSGDERKNIQDRLQRGESLLAALVGVYWERSVYSRLQPKDIIPFTRRAVIAWLHGLAAQGPLILVVEDLQWVDSESLRVLGMLWAESFSRGIAMVACSRIAPDGSRPQLPAGDMPQQTVVLGYLPATAIGELMTDIVGKTPRQEAIKLVQERTNGNPFYIEELCLYLLNSQRIVYTDGGFACGDCREGAVPMDIKSLIVARVDRLEPRVKTLCKTAAVCGNSFTAAVIEHAIGTSDAKILLNRGEKGGLWVRESVDGYLFSHHMLRDVVYAMQPKSALRDTHRTIANAMGMLYKEEKQRYGEIAFHFSRGGAWRQAIDYYFKANRYFCDIFRYQDALQHAQDAKELCLKHLPPGVAELGEALKCMGMAYEGMGDLQHAAQLLQESLHLCLELYGEQHERTAKLQVTLGNILLQQGKYPQAQDHFQAALKANLALFGEKHDHTAQCYGGLSKLYLLTGKHEKATRYIERATAIQYEVLGDMNVPMALSCNTAGVIHASRGHLQQALAMFHQTYDIYRTILGKKHMQTVETLLNIGMAYKRMGKLEKALSCLQEVLAVRRTVSGPDHFATGMCLTATADIYQAMGSYSQAKDLLLQALAIYKRTFGDKHQHIMSAQQNLGNTYEKLGQAEKAREYHNKALAMALDIFGEEHPITAICLTSVGKDHYQQGQYDKALSHCKKALAIKQHLLGDSNRSLVFNYQLLGEIYARQGARKKALAMLLQALDIARKTDRMDPLAASCHAEVGDMYLAQDDYAGAHSHFTQALSILQSLGLSHKIRELDLPAKIAAIENKPT